MSIPVNRIVPGQYFAPTRKYHNSIAMILDRVDGWSDATGDANEFGRYTTLFADITIELAYKMVVNYIDSYVDSQPVWAEVRMAIDILSETGQWLLVTDDRGFVDAVPFETKELVQKEFQCAVDEYSEWLGEG